MNADIVSSIHTLLRGFQEGLSARTVYGEPVTAAGITVVPVATVTSAFTGGGGGGPGGGGGGVAGGLVQPAGYIEVSEAGSRWVPVEGPRSEQLLRILGIVAALLPIGGRRGVLTRLLLALAVLALSGQLGPSRTPLLPEELRFGRPAREAT
ncbi:MAG: hypothetical protein A2148_11655 [Chloroflexi bacterium RBG_16_68_14]|nr:MAG: hypothetical protein A2148_11655 [Chloroflexi bacterium RBG_16_68_14]